MITHQSPSRIAFQPIFAAILAIMLALGSQTAVANRATQSTISPPLPMLTYDAAQTSLNQLDVLDGKLIFTLHDSTGTSLWASDGTAQGTVSLTTLAPPGSSTSIGPMTVFDDRLFFSVRDNNQGIRALWVTDGTIPGSRELMSISVNWLVATTSQLTVASNEAHGLQLWRLDAGQTVMQPITLIAQSDQPFTYTWSTTAASLYGVVLFDVIQAYQPGHTGIATTTLWRSDGTRTGTWQIKDFGSAPIGLGQSLIKIDRMTHSGDYVYFVGRLSPYAIALWRSDGTEAETIPVTTPDSRDSIRWLTDGDRRLFFVMDDGVHGAELWITSGIVGSTRLVRDIAPAEYPGDPIGSAPNNLVFGSGATLFFSANDGTHGRELWQSDGTEAGTVMVADLAPGAAGSSPDHLIPVWGAVVFSADGYGGVEPWLSDGTAAGTYQIADIVPGPAGSDAAQYILASGRLFFTAGDAAQRTLWVVDEVSQIIGPEGGVMTVWLDGTVVGFPRDAFAQPARVTYKTYSVRRLGTPEGLEALDRSFELSATTDSGIPISSPLTGYTLKVPYRQYEGRIVFLSSLALYRWDGAQWAREATSLHNMRFRTLYASPGQFGIWAVIGTMYHARMPIVVQSP